MTEADDSPTERFSRLPRSQLRAGFVFARDRVERGVLAASLERSLGRRVELKRFTTYAALADAVVDGTLDLAWLPPAAYVRARREADVRAVAALERGGARSYRSALLARTGSFERIEDVARARAAWVDPWSAAGYLLPRAMIAGYGLDLERAIASQRFFGSYDSAIDALTVRSADIAGGFCTVDEDGKIVEPGWSRAAPVRVLAISAPIPCDLLCTTHAVSDADADAIGAALTGALGFAVASAVGGSALVTPREADYDSLERAVAPS